MRAELRGGDPRERIVRTAYDLFARDGLHAVGIDRIVAEASVAKSTLYRYFSSKEELVLAVLQRRVDLWTRGWLELEANRRSLTPDGKLLAIFDAFDEWFHRDDYEGCLFMNTLFESDQKSPVGAAAAAGLDDARSFVRLLAKEAHVRDPLRFAARWHLLMVGAIEQANEGQRDAAKDAKAVGRLLLADEGIGPSVPRRANR